MSMELTKLSKIKILREMSKWELPKDFVDPMFNYLIHGWHPGSFFSKVLANDCWGALQSCHPNNDIVTLKHLVGWISTDVPPPACGSMTNVLAWTKLSDQDRRTLLEHHGIIYTEQQEILATLRDDRPELEPYFY